jgi:protein CpxP
MPSSTLSVTHRLLASALGIGLVLAAVPPAARAEHEVHHQAHASHHHHDRGGGHGMRGVAHGPAGFGFLRGLDLSEQQRDRVFEIMHRQAPALRERARAIGKARQDLGALAMSADYDEARARSLSEGLAAATASLALERARTAHAVWEILSAEQRRQVEERWARRGPGSPMERG